MKIFDVDWCGVLSALPRWESVEGIHRRVLLDSLKPTGDAPYAVLGDAAVPLVLTGLVEPSVNGKAVTVAEPARRLVRVLRAMDRHRILQNHDLGDLERYIEEHLTWEETALFGDLSWRYQGRKRVAETVSSHRWPLSFLEAHDLKAWEGRFATRDDRLHLQREDAALATKRLVERLAGLREAVSFSDLPALVPELDETLLASALHAALRYLLVYPALRSEDLEPMVGLWPPVSHRLHAPVAEYPAPARVRESFQEPMLVRDLTGLLVHCVTEPPRLRMSDCDIFKRSRDDLESNLAPVPHWIELSKALTSTSRLDRALAAARGLELLAVGSNESGMVLKVTEQGEKWLSASDEDRLRGLLDEMDRVREEDRFRGVGGRLGLYWLPDRCYRGAWELARGLENEVKLAFSEIGGGFVPWLPYLVHLVQENPLFELFWNGGRRPRANGAPRTDEDLDLFWRCALEGFFWERLVVLGGVRLGRGSGDELAFRITDVGQCLLGLSDRFELPGSDVAEIAVQPNFEIVFLSPSPRSEALLGRFCERLSYGVGVLFRITRASVYRAVRGGLSGEEMERTLDELSSKPVAQNVRRQVRYWADRTRRVRLRYAVLLECGDPETASRVLSKGGKTLSPLTETVLELEDGEPTTRIAKKLRDVGIFLEE